jgi:cyanophycin synthetase
MANIKAEPHREKSACDYCGDAPINHAVFYYTSLISMAVDNHVVKVTKNVPEWIKSLVDRFIFFTFDTFVFLGAAKLSDNIDLANTFRSKVVWEEARRRGIDMKQLVLLGKPVDQYRTKLRGQNMYFNSLPIPPEFLTMQYNWDDKFILKQKLQKKNIPIPKYIQFPAFYPQNLEKIFSKLEKPIIVKPRIGSRGRHTITNIRTLAEFKHAVKIASQICSYLVAEEHIEGDVCRATLVDGKLMGFYRGSTPYVIGNGKSTVAELIVEKDNTRPDRVEKVLVNDELRNYVKRLGYEMEDILPEGTRLGLTHRTGRLFGGVTREILNDLHPSFLPILEEAGKIVGLKVMGFDCIVPDPTKDANSQKWGIIECNTLPFIDLHYYALYGEPQNIAGAIWDIWQKAGKTNAR